MINRLKYKIYKKLIKHISQSNLSVLEKYNLSIYSIDKMNMRKFPILDTNMSTKLLRWVHFIKKVKNVEGEIVEAGVAHGRTVKTILTATKRLKINKKIYGFDSFEGFSKPTEIDLKGTADIIENRLNIPGYLSEEMVLEAFKADKDRVIIKKGWFKDTLVKENLPSRISLLHLDCDIYEPTLEVLSACRKLLNDNALIIFDEYHEYQKWPGVKKAADEFAKENNLVITFDEYANRYYIKL